MTPMRTETWTWHPMPRALPRHILQRAGSPVSSCCPGQGARAEAHPRPRGHSQAGAGVELALGTLVPGGGLREVLPTWLRPSFPMVPTFKLPALQVSAAGLPRNRPWRGPASPGSRDPGSKPASASDVPRAGGLSRPFPRPVSPSPSAAWLGRGLGWDSANPGSRAHSWPAAQAPCDVGRVTSPL